MQFSTKIDGFEQNDSQGFENSYNSYEQYPLENFFIFTIYQNYTLALIYDYTILKTRIYDKWVCCTETESRSPISFCYASSLNAEWAGPTGKRTIWNF